MHEVESASEVLARWIRGEASLDDERDLFDNCEITACEFEFGPHDNHTECERIMADMNPDYPDERDYSGWYGGEQGYNDGLRWSDFV